MSSAFAHSPYEIEGGCLEYLRGQAQAVGSPVVPVRRQSYRGDLVEAEEYFSVSNFNTDRLLSLKATAMLLAVQSWLFKSTRFRLFQSRILWSVTSNLFLIPTVGNYIKEPFCVSVATTFLPLFGKFASSSTPKISQLLLVSVAGRIDFGLN